MVQYRIAPGKRIAGCSIAKVIHLLITSILLHNNCCCTCSDSFCSFGIFLDNFHRQQDQISVLTQTKHRGSKIRCFSSQSHRCSFPIFWNCVILGGTRIYSTCLENNSVNTEFACSLMGPLLLVLVTIALALFGLLCG